jgi:hypothetical protein
MNNLLFTALIIALIYYFFYYRPSQKKLANSPLKHNGTTQTDELDTDELAELKKYNQQKENTIIGLNKSYKKLETKKNKEINELQRQISELVKRPLKPTNSKSVQTNDKDLANTLNTLIKDIQELNQELN